MSVAIEAGAVDTHDMGGYPAVSAGRRGMIQLGGMEVTVEHDQLFEAMFKVQQELPPAIRRLENEFYGSKYADLPEVWRVLRPLLKDAGLVVIQPPVHAADGSLLMTIVKHTPSGEMLNFPTPIFHEKKNPPAFGSGVTYARRQVICALFEVMVVGEDDDGAKGSERLEEDGGSTKDDRNAYERARDTIRNETDAAKLMELQDRVNTQERLANLTHSESAVLTQLVLIRNCTTADRLKERTAKIEAMDDQTGVGSEAKKMLLMEIARKAAELPEEAKQ